MDTLVKLTDDTYSFETKGVEYIVTLKNNDTTTIQIFNHELVPVPMTKVNVWDKIETEMYKYVDSLVVS